MTRARRVRAWAVVCVATGLALGMLVVGANGRSASSRSLPPRAGDGIPTAAVIKRSGEPLRMAWQARVGVVGAEFHVYRGPVAGHLRRVGTLPARQGTARYQFRDPTATASSEIYEVRLEDGTGRERVLARAVCTRSDSLGTGGGVRDARSEAALSAPLTEVPAALCRDLWYAATPALDDNGARRPETPPPRVPLSRA